MLLRQRPPLQQVPRPPLAAEFGAGLLPRLVRTNSVVGELAEMITLKHYGGRLAISSTTGYDLETSAHWCHSARRNTAGMVIARICTSSHSDQFSM
jgi:hypothetical protein